MAKKTEAQKDKEYKFTKGKYPTSMFGVEMPPMDINSNRIQIDPEKIAAKPEYDALYSRPKMDERQMVISQPVETEQAYQPMYKTVGDEEPSSKSSWDWGDGDVNELIGRALIQAGPALVGYLFNKNEGIYAGTEAGKEGIKTFEKFKEAKASKDEKEAERKNRYDIALLKQRKGTEKDVEYKKMMDRFKNEDILRKELINNPSIKNAVTIGAAWRRINEAGPTGPGDLALIFSYMKMLDPTSVVREGEQASAANAGTVPESLWGLYNRLREPGGKLAPTLRKKFLAESSKIWDQEKGLANKYFNKYQTIAKNRQLDINNVIFNPISEIDRMGQASIKERPSYVAPPEPIDVNDPNIPLDVLQKHLDEVKRYNRAPSSVVPEEYGEGDFDMERELEEELRKRQ